jgi:dephospho-CoA kinase
MLVFGLTGGIASGKSTVSKRIRELGIPVIDADLLAREVVQRHTEGFEAVVAAFGKGVVGPDGELDRKALGAIVFADPVAREKLNGMLHSRIGARSMELIARLQDQRHKLACYDAALLVEGGLADMFRPLVVVAATPTTQVERIVKRDGLTPDEALARVNAQLPLAEKVAMADYVIENDGSLEDLISRTDGVIAAIRSGESP